MNALTPAQIGELDRLEKIVEAGQQTFVEVGMALAEIKAKKLYERDYSTFEAYCQGRWKWGKRYANQVIEAANVVLSLPESGRSTSQISTAAQALELSKVPEPARETVLQTAAKAAKEEERPMTAKDIKKAARDIPLPKQPPIPPAKPDERRDHTGWVIPEKVLPLWDYAAETQSVLDQISTLRGIIRSAQEHDRMELSEINMSGALANVDQLFANWKRGIPYAVCISCQGRCSDGCQSCKGRGFVSKFFWDTCVPKELKDIRAKSSKL